MSKSGRFRPHNLRRLRGPLLRFLRYGFVTPPPHPHGPTPPLLPCTAGRSRLKLSSLSCQRLFCSIVTPRRPHCVPYTILSPFWKWLSGFSHPRFVPCLGLTPFSTPRSRLKVTRPPRKIFKDHRVPRPPRSSIRQVLRLAKSTQNCNLFNLVQKVLS